MASLNTVPVVRARDLPGAGGSRLGVPECERGTGALIANLDSPGRIEGVELNPFPLWPDDRGYFFEVARMGKGLPAEFPAATTQVSAALSYPGTIKAFHFHRHQTDFWVPAKGMFQVVLVDFRVESNTFGQRNTLLSENCARGKC